MKLHVLMSTVSAELNPDVTNFFHVTTEDTEAGDTLAVDPGDFFQDDGSEVTELPELAANNSIFQVYVNGVLQMADLSQYTPGADGVGSFAFTVPEDGPPLLANTPIVLKIINFAPTLDANLET